MGTIDFPLQREPFDDGHVAAAPSPPPLARKGRGAVSNLQGRYEVNGRERFDDGWAVDDDEAPVFKTVVTDETAKSILSRNTSPDIPFSVSLNPYRGCEHGCIYCFARPTHSYLGLSPGLDFESRLFAKVNAPELLRRELAKPGYVPEHIAIGVNTDAYQPCERERKLTRSVLEVLAECRHPAGLITKSSLIERDIDILAPMAAKGLACAAITHTTLDAEISRTLEPRAAAPMRRLRTIRTLAEAGIPVGVSVAPQIPFINEDMEQVLEAARDAGATSAFYTVVRLPWEVNPLMREWLEQHYPQRAARVLARIQDLHGIDEAGRAAGKAYDAAHATRMKGTGLWADLLRQRFGHACRRLGLNRQRMELDVTQFRPALARGQGCLF